MAVCPDCGFELAGLRSTDHGDRIFDCEYDENGYSTATTQIAAASGEAASVLRGADIGAARVRPAPGHWSAIEHACHLRDVLAVQRERVLQARRGFGAERIAMGREERVEHDGYNDQEPGDVAIQLEQMSMLLANVFDRLERADWELMVSYAFPDEVRRSLRWLAVHTAHEAVHHAHEIASLIVPSAD
ncbi:MAG: DinB family protein [Actinomycetota bacterium]